MSTHDQQTLPMQLAAMRAAGEIAAAMGWSLPYVLGVLGRWKTSAVYCQAVLSHDQRIALRATARIEFPNAETGAGRADGRWRQGIGLDVPGG